MPRRRDGHASTRSCASCFEKYWQTPQIGALERMKSTSSAWGLIGSESPGRHLQYEKFYAGASSSCANHNFREAHGRITHKVVDT